MRQHSQIVYTFNNPCSKLCWPPLLSSYISYISKNGKHFYLKEKKAINLFTLLKKKLGMQSLQLHICVSTNIHRSDCITHRLKLQLPRFPKGHHAASHTLPAKALREWMLAGQRFSPAQHRFDREPWPWKRDGSGLKDACSRTRLSLGKRAWGMGLKRTLEWDNPGRARNADLSLSSSAGGRGVAVRGFYNSW